MKTMLPLTSAKSALRALALLGTLAFSTVAAHADAIGSIISYQGQISDSTGKPVADGTQSITFKIYEDGTSVFTQSMSVATVGGVFNTFLSVGALTFDPAKTYNLGVTVGGQPEVTHPIAAVPVALNAANATNATTAVTATTATNVQVPLSLTGSANGAILSVTNSGTGPAIDAAGPINTNRGYSIGNSSVLNNTLGGIGSFAVGPNAGQSSTGDNNFFLGFNAGRGTTTGGGNSFVGTSAGIANTTGATNTFIGSLAGHRDETGSNNVAIGYNAGGFPMGSNNIHIGNVGVSGDDNLIRLGTSQVNTFIAGISGVSVAGVPVLVDSNGKLGTVNASSLRYKQDVHNMGHDSDSLLKLRPVTFRYTSQFMKTATPSPVQHGLIAEEVAKVDPQMVQFDASGQPQGVKYGDLPIMLLNLVQQQQRTIEQLQERLKKVEAKH